MTNQQAYFREAWAEGVAAIQREKKIVCPVDTAIRVPKVLLHNARKVQCYQPRRTPARRPTPSQFQYRHALNN
jgi:hypothetical protein